VAEFFTKVPDVDFVELTPRLVFLNRWARGVVQTGDWQVCVCLCVCAYGCVRACVVYGCGIWVCVYMGVCVYMDVGLYCLRLGLLDGLWFTPVVLLVRP
jgi:hypothetical protein